MHGSVESSRCVLSSCVMIRDQHAEGRRRNGAISTHAELLTPAERVLRLFPDRRRPEQFHIDRDLIAKALRRLARQVERRAL